MNINIRHNDLYIFEPANVDASHDCAPADQTNLPLDVSTVVQLVCRKAGKALCFVKTDSEKVRMHDPIRETVRVYRAVTNRTLSRHDYVPWLK